MPSLLPGIFCFQFYLFYLSLLSFPFILPSLIWLLNISGDYEAAIREHQQELALSEVLNDVIGRAVANRKIGECYAEMGNIEAALKVGFPYEKASHDAFKRCRSQVHLWCLHKEVCYVFLCSTSAVTWSWLALSAIMQRSRELWPQLVEPTCSGLNLTNQKAA